MQRMKDPRGLPVVYEEPAPEPCAKPEAIPKELEAIADDTERITALIAEFNLIVCGMCGLANARRCYMRGAKGMTRDATPGDVKTVENAVGVQAFRDDLVREAHDIDRFERETRINPNPWP